MEPTVDAAKLKLIAELAGTILLAAQYRRDNMTRQILVKIRDEWRRLPMEDRPWGFWVREYAPISANADSVDFDWMRLVAAKTLGPDTIHPRLSLIGQTAFAPYEDSDDYYIEVLWGGRWGMAGRISSGSEGQMLIKQELWRA